MYSGLVRSVDYSIFEIFEREWTAGASAFCNNEKANAERRKTKKTSFTVRPVRNTRLAPGGLL